MAVAAPSLEEARSRAVASVAELYAAPRSAHAAKIAELLRTRAAEFVGRARFKAGQGVVEVKIDKLARALNLAGLLRPAGFASNAAKSPRVLILVSESEVLLDLGVGPAGDALRRGLSVYGLAAIDGRDSLNGFSAKGKSAAELAAAGGRAGANWVLIAAASASAERDAASGAWRANASLVADPYEVGGSLRMLPLDQIRSDAAALDVSSAAARVAALDRAGMEVAARAAEAIARAQGGRSEAAVFVTGNADLPRLKALLSALRDTEGVLGAFLGTWRGEEGAVILRVFLAGIKTDGLAARLLRREPTLTLLSVEPDDGRLAVEIPGGRGQ